ncbi:MAG: minor capsid protein [Armatimonadetes bacterium]|nr:minor capsid protein [Armatimonadota bacterium]
MIVEEIAQYLQSLEIGTFDPAGVIGDIFIETMPDTPDTCIGLYTTAGMPPDTKTSISRPSVQIIVRGSRDPRTASSLATRIQEALHGLHSMTFIPDGSRVMLCSARNSEPVSLGRDDNQRHEYSINLQLIIGGS